MIMSEVSFKKRARVVLIAFVVSLISAHLLAQENVNAPHIEQIPFEVLNAQQQEVLAPLREQWSSFFGSASTAVNQRG